jgi:small-conductance mechanosensitive channel
VKVGDRVEVGHLVGQVRRIGSRSTWVATNDNIVVILPNSEFISKPVINWTANDRLVRFAVPVGVSYESNPDHVRKTLLTVATGNSDVLADPAPDVIFTGFGDSALQFELRVWTSSQVNIPNILKSDLYFEIFRAFQQEKIEIPFPQRDLHLRSIPQEMPILIMQASAAMGKE